MNAYLKIVLLFATLQSGFVFAQSRSDALKRQGEELMSAGRFVDAIDLLNKYVAANPRFSGGYHLRGLCYEQRMEYQSAVVDFRKALRLPPENPKIKIDLDRVLDVWHKQLQQKIDGYKKDVELNPNLAFTYLEIGKCYRLLEEWKDAEFWYDEYLKRDDTASPDEIIRYSEILTKTGSISKGEKILKRFVNIHPDDWQLWSRYGYFSMWMGKNKTAEVAFTKSLSRKPSFKEAEEGLKLIKRQNNLLQSQSDALESAEIENPIDKMFRQLQSNPENDKLRFDLVDELTKVGRYEDANEQLQYLQSKYSEEENYKQIFKKVNDYRDSLFNKSVNTYTEILKNNPNDKVTVMKLANAYGNHLYYDSAIEILDEYLKEVPADQDLDARFMYAKYSAWNYEWEKSVSQLDKLLLLEPNNLDYQLLRAQVAVWTLTDLDLAEKYLQNAYQNNPKNLTTLVALINLYSWEKDFPTASQYLNQAKVEYPNNIEVEKIQAVFNTRFQAYEELKTLEIKELAGKLFNDGKCLEALSKYDSYYEKRRKLSTDEKIEYAGIASCAKEYNKAILLYDEVLSDQYDYKIGLLRAENYVLIDDTSHAKSELERLTAMNPEDNQAQLLLADVYAMIHKFEEAEVIYRFQREKAQNDEKEREIDLKLLSLGNRFVVDRQFPKGKILYDEIAAKNYSPEIQELILDGLISYSDSLTNNKQYDQAEKVLKKLEKKSTDVDKLDAIYKSESKLAYQLALDKELDDAAEIFEELDPKISNQNSKKDLDQKMLFVGDEYVKDESYGDAEDIYEELLTTASDSSQIQMLKERIDSIPPHGIIRKLGYILPKRFCINPFTDYYHDNEQLSVWKNGSSLDIGISRFLSIGGLWSNYLMDNTIIRRNFTLLKGIGTVRLSKLLSVSGAFGAFTPEADTYHQIGDLTIKYEIPGNYGFAASYENTDLRAIFYSRNIITQFIRADIFRINWYYIYSDLVKLTLNYNFLKLNDTNKGNDFQVRVGRRLLSFGMFGYEYYFADYLKISQYYYSPQDFDSHSIWAQFDYKLDLQCKFSAGGKIGYVPTVDLFVSEFWGEVDYNPLSILVLTGRIEFDNSFRYGSPYKTYNGILTAHLGIF